MGNCASNEKDNKGSTAKGRSTMEPGRLAISTNQTKECKVVILGNTGVGKSSIAVRYLQNRFSDQHLVTIGAQFQQPKIPLKNGGFLKVNLWDTAGEEKFRAMIPMYYKNARAAMLVYDVGNMKSFQDIEYWITELDEQIKKDELLLILLGNKCDIEVSKREVETQLAQSFATNNNMLFYEVSAKTGQNVVELFKKMAEEIYKTMESQLKK